MGQIEKAIQKGMVDSYHLYPERVQAFVEKNPDLFATAATAVAHAPAPEAVGSGGAPSDAAGSSLPKLRRRLPPPTRLNPPPRAGLPEEVRSAAICGWLIKMGRRFPFRWYERYYAFDAHERRLAYYTFKRDHGFVFRGQGELVRPHAERTRAQRPMRWPKRLANATHGPTRATATPLLVPPPRATSPRHPPMPPTHRRCVRWPSSRHPCC